MSAIFQTPRLYLAPLSMDDLDAFVDMQSNPKVMQYTGQKPMSRDECMEDLHKLMTHYTQHNNGFWVWGVRLRSSNELIGTGALIMEAKGAEIGYRLREKFWGNGYGIELASGLIHYAFTDWNCPLIFADVDQRNAPSIHILDKTMKRIRAFWNEESQTNDYYYELSKSDYDQI